MTRGEIRRAMDAARTWNDRDAFLAAARRIFDLPAEEQGTLWTHYRVAVVRLNGAGRWLRRSTESSRRGRRRTIPDDEAA